MCMIEWSGSGTLSTMARPRGNDWLDDEMNGLREAGTDIFVSMLTSDEVNELYLQEEAEAAAAQRPTAAYQTLRGFGTCCASCRWP